MDGLSLEGRTDFRLLERLGYPKKITNLTPNGGEK